MNKVFSLLAVSTVLSFFACEDTTSTNTDEISSSSLASSSNLTSSSSEMLKSTVESCSLLGGIFCSETPSGEVASAECTAQGGTFSTGTCPAGEKLKCTDLDVPGKVGLKSTAYVYEETWVQTIQGLASEAGSEDICAGIPLLLAQFEQ